MTTDLHTRRLRGYQLFSVLWLLSSGSAMAQSPIVRIEEDWEIQVQQPDEQLDAPQLTTTMLPFGESSELLFQVDWNHGSQPAFSNGGYQVRVGTEQECLVETRQLVDQRLYVADEQIRWTQVVQKEPNGFVLGITNGLGGSWGSFGGNDAFVFLHQADVDGVLDSYQPAASVANSGVTYAGNRVSRLRLSKVRYFNSLGQSWEVLINADIQ